MSEPKIDFFHTNDCHTWKISLKDLEEVLKEEKIDAKINVQLVETQEQADRFKFTGSPTIIINEKNVDPTSREQKNFVLLGCRLYFYKGKSFEFPPKEMIKDALKER